MLDNASPNRPSLLPSPRLALPSDVLQLVILELRSGAAVKALSRTCHALHDLIVHCGLELAAAWLWRRHGDRALFKAARHNDAAMLRQLAEVHHADIAAHRDALLRQASCEGLLQVVQFLLTVPELQINSPGPGGATALHDACCFGHEAVVLELLKQPSIDVNKLDLSGHTALHWAVFHNHIAATRALLGHPSIDVAAKTSATASFMGISRTALDLARSKRHSGMEALLTGHAACSKATAPQDPQAQGEAAGSGQAATVPKLAAEASDDDDDDDSDGRSSK